MANVATAKRNDTASNQYEGMRLDRLLSAQSSVQEEIKALKKIETQIDAAMRDRVALAVKAARDELQKYEGTVHAVVDGYDVASTVPKRVEWDTSKLDLISAQMDVLGYDAADWIDFELSVPEAKYKAMPPPLRSLCDTARLLKHGKETFTFTATE